MFKKLLIKEIKSKEGFLHFRRWKIIQNRFFSIYIHGIYLNDYDQHMHNHPWNFLTFILYGGYWCSVYNSQTKQVRHELIRQFSFRYMNKKHYHKLNGIINPTYTLVITGPNTKNWGYNVNEKYIDHETYRKLKYEKKLEDIK